jgi:hypothetical protein
MTAPDLGAAGDGWVGDARVSRSQRMSQRHQFGPFRAVLRGIGPGRFIAKSPKSLEFRPPSNFARTAFKTAAFDRSATSPEGEG